MYNAYSIYYSSNNGLIRELIEGSVDKYSYPRWLDSLYEPWQEARYMKDEAWWTNHDIWMAYWHSKLHILNDCRNRRGDSESLVVLIAERFKSWVIAEHKSKFDRTTLQSNDMWDFLEMIEFPLIATIWEELERMEPPRGWRRLLH